MHTRPTRVKKDGERIHIKFHQINFDHLPRTLFLCLISFGHLNVFIYIKDEQVTRHCLRLRILFFLLIIAAQTHSLTRSLHIIRYFNAQYWHVTRESPVNNSPHSLTRLSWCKHFTWLCAKLNNECDTHNYPTVSVHRVCRLLSLQMDLSPLLIYSSVGSLAHLIQLHQIAKCEKWMNKNHKLNNLTRLYVSAMHLTRWGWLLWWRSLIGRKFNLQKCVWHNLCLITSGSISESEERVEEEQEDQVESDWLQVITRLQRVRESEAQWMCRWKKESRTSESVEYFTREHFIHWQRASKFLQVTS